jgi:UDP-glucuronate decarboxylase
VSTTMQGDHVGNRTSTGRRKARKRAAVLVSGGAGFIGSHLCSTLLSRGERVICIDNFCTSSEESVVALQEHKNFELRRQDVASLQIDEIGSVSAIYNLACAASPIHYQRDPLDTLLSSVHGMHHLLRLAQRDQVPIFQASTSEIYGHPTTHPQPETYWGHVNSMGPRSCYDEGKRCAETLCYIYREQYGVAVRIARIFNTYGPGMQMNDGRVVINFIVQALSDEPITIYGDGTQTRSFCYVDDLVDGITRLMGVHGTFGGPVNLGNPNEIDVGELAAQVIRLTGSRSKVVRRALPVDDPPRRRPDISLAWSELGWRPSTDLETGLRRTIKDVQRRLQHNDPSLLAIATHTPFHRSSTEISVP